MRNNLRLMTLPDEQLHALVVRLQRLVWSAAARCENPVAVQLSEHYADALDAARRELERRRC